MGIISDIKKLLGIKPDDWEVVEQISAKYTQYQRYMGHRLDGTGVERTSYYKVYYSKSRNVHKISVEGFYPSNVSEDQDYQNLKLKYKIR